MSSDNPFAAPREEFSPRVYGVQADASDIWRSGKALVFTHGARLPARCIKCNSPIDVAMLPRTLYYYPPWIAIFILCNLLILIVVAFVFRKKAAAELGVCADCSARRRNAILMCWSAVGLAIAAFASMAFLPDLISPQAPEKIGVPLAFGGLGLLIFAAIYGILRCQLVVVQKIDKLQVRLTRISPDYLAMFRDGV